MKKSDRHNVLKYTGPSSIKKIEERLLEIEHEKPMRIHNAIENYQGDSMEDEIERKEIDYLEVEKRKLELKRQFILDSREGWKARLIWSIFAPIIVSIITASVISILIK